MDVDMKQVDKGKVKAFFNFDLLVLPTLVKFGFALGVVVMFLVGLGVPFMMAGVAVGSFNFLGFLVGIVAAVIYVGLGLVWLRIACESMIVLFKIHDVLVPKKPVDTAQGKPAEAAAAAPEKPSAPPPPAA